jgi:hypothetical protein
LDNLPGLLVSVDTKQPTLYTEEKKRYLNLMCMGKSVCPGCGLALESGGTGLDESYNASRACRRLFDELSAFTLSLRDKDFIHQLVVDAYAAQHSGPDMKPIATAFALIGLYLTFERGYTGREVQLAHMGLGKTRRERPRFNPPAAKGALTVLDVVRGISEENYKERLNAWGKSVWLLWLPQHESVSKLVEMYLDLPQKPLPP